MTDDRPGRTRDPHETYQLMVPELEIARAVEAAKVQLRQEWIANIDRQALERAITEAATAKDLADGAKKYTERTVQTAHRRWITILVVLALLGAGLAMMFAYGFENRARIERLERVTDGGR